MADENPNTDDHKKIDGDQVKNQEFKRDALPSKARFNPMIGQYVTDSTNYPGIAPAYSLKPATEALTPDKDLTLAQKVDYAVRGAANFVTFGYAEAIAGAMDTAVDGGKMADNIALEEAKSHPLPEYLTKGSTVAYLRGQQALNAEEVGSTAAGLAGIAAFPVAAAAGVSMPVILGGETANLGMMGASMNDSTIAHLIAHDWVEKLEVVTPDHPVGDLASIDHGLGGHRAPEKQQDSHQR